MNVLVGIYSRFASWNMPASYVERLRAEFPQHRFVHATSDEEAEAQIGDADVAFMSEVRRHHLAAAAALRWIHSPSAGVGGMLFPEMLRSPVIISNSRGLGGDTIGEHVIAVTLALFRKLPAAIRSQADRRWAQDEVAAPPPIRQLAGARVLLIGAGGIGAACAWRFDALGARVTAVRRRVDQPLPRGVAAAAPPDRLLELLGEADVVVLAAPHTRDTRELIGAPALAAMRQDAVLVNVSRGNLVDEAALADALRRRAIGGAALDVFAQEPLDPASPLWDLPNVLITPHMSWYRSDHWAAATDLFAENLRRFEAGRPLINVVDKQAGY
ncbi:MAG TPA: D-2-hydroxyacid dehydrogenase [Vicinamibacterales bacterium]|nr:D-2-hydroxyacid dehydrogenase [Vicinamibacterales bacterium]